MNDKEIALEVCKCKEDFVYFCETYLKILDPRDSRRGLISFKLHNFQKRYIKIINAKRHVIGKKFRCGGFTTVGLAWMLWQALFELDWTGMYCCKTDTDAVAGNQIVRCFYEYLPEWLQEFCPITKNNDHEMCFDGFGTKLLFRCPQACHGKSMNFIFIDEPAFIKDMENHWEAMFPVISTDSKVLVMGTPNGKGNWFHQTYVAAESHENDFYVCYNEFTEYPEYRKPSWQAKVKKNLGPRGYLQEILAEFFTKEDLENNIFLMPTDDDVKGGIGLTKNQEGQLKEVTAQRRSAQSKLAKQISEWSESGSIDQKDPDLLKEALGEEEFSQIGKLVGEDEEYGPIQECWRTANDIPKGDKEYKPDPDVYPMEGEVFEKPPAIRKKMKYESAPKSLEDKEVNIDTKRATLKDHLKEIHERQQKEQWGKDEVRIGSNMKDSTHYKDGVLYQDRKVEQMTSDQVKSTFKRLHKDHNPEEVKHPEFDKQPHPSCVEDMIELAECVAACDCPEYNTWANDLIIQARKQQSFYQGMEDAVNFEYLDPETLHLCGLLGVDEFKDHAENWGRPDLVILHKLAEDPQFPTNLNLQFLGGQLCVNAVPTTIKEDDVCDMFNGLQAMKSSQEALDDVVDVLRNKLKVLFGKEIEENEYTETSLCE